MFATEVIVGRWGKVLVHGDAGTCVFAYYSGWDRDPPEHAIRWMGETRSWGYIAEKAAAGTGREAVYTTDDRVARANILEEIACLRAGGGRIAPDLGPYRAALRALDDGETVPIVRHELYHNARGVDVEWLAGVGEVIDSRVFYAHAALARLCAIWDAEKATASAEGQTAHG
jgi:hypothetical protein